MLLAVMEPKINPKSDDRPSTTPAKTFEIRKAPKEFDTVPVHDKDGGRGRPGASEQEGGHATGGERKRM